MCRYAHFMLREIMEQADVVRKTIVPRIKNGNYVALNLGYDIDKPGNLTKSVTVE